MPYNIKTKDGIELTNIPDEMPSDAPQLQQLVQGERTKRRQASPEYQAKLEAQRAADRKQYAPEGGVMENIGAGMHNLWEGAKDITGNLSDEELAESRATKQQLAEGTTGGKWLQFAGEVIPTLAIPAGIVGAGARGAVAGGRAVMGIPKAVKAAQAARLGTGAAIAEGAGAGGAYGALQPTMEDESRLGNVALGATLGGALPGAAAAARKGYRNFTAGGAKQRVAEAMQDELGAGASGELRTAIGKQYFPRGAEDIPLSTAGVLENPALARLERTSRMDPAAQPGWHDLDKRQAEEAWNAVSRATGEADELVKRRGERQTNWDTNWARAEEGTKPRKFSQAMGDLKGTLDEMARSPEAVGNRKVMDALREVDDAVTMMGGEFTPAHLQQLRAQLNGRPSLDAKATALQGAPRENVAIRTLISKLDETLNTGTGGRWDKVRQGYTEDSARVEASKAAKMVRGAFIDEDTGRVIKRAAAKDVPEVTQAGVGRAMNAARRPDKSMALSQRANEELMAVQEALRKQGITDEVARTATAGRGPFTAGDIAGAVGSAAGVPGAGILARTGQGIKNFGQGKYNEQLANALRDPGAMLKMLEAKVAAREPLSRNEELMLNALRGTQGALASPNP